MDETIEASDSGSRIPISEMVSLLNAGRAVGLCDGRQTAVIANGAMTPADDAVASNRNGSPATLLLRDVASAEDFLREASPVAQRIMRKGWPGAVRLIFAQGADPSLVEQLSADLRPLVFADQGLSLCVPRSEILRDLLRQVAYPLMKFSVKEQLQRGQSDLTLVSADAESVETEASIHIDGDRWELISEGGLSRDDVARMAVERILFVCTGNTCRSPMAEGLFRRLLAERIGCADSELGSHGFEVASAGLSASHGSPASPESAALCNACGVDLSSHASQPFTERLLRETDRIYAMTAAHRQAIVSRNPERERDVRLLSAVGADVSDPIGWGPAAYEQCFQEITEGLKALVDEVAATH